MSSGGGRWACRMSPQRGRHVRRRERRARWLSVGGAAACGSSAQGGRFTSMSSKWRAVSSFRALCGAEPIAGVARGARVSLERCEGPAVSPVSRAAGADLRWHTTRFIDDGALWRSRFGLCVATASYFPGLAAGGAELPAPGGMTPPPGWRRGVGSAVERRIRRVAVRVPRDRRRARSFAGPSCAATARFLIVIVVVVWVLLMNTKWYAC